MRNMLLLIVSFLLFAPASTAWACSVAAKLHFENASPEDRKKRAFELAAPWLNLEMNMDMTQIAYELKSSVSCEKGMADGFPCQNVDLVAHMPLASIGGGNGSDSWGWTDSTTGKEYVLMGRSNGTAFIDISTVRLKSADISGCMPSSTSRRNPLKPLVKSS